MQFVAPLIKVLPLLLLLLLTLQPQLVSATTLSAHLRSQQNTSTTSSEPVNSSTVVLNAAINSSASSLPSSSSWSSSSLSLSSPVSYSPASSRSSRGLAQNSSTATKRVASACLASVRDRLYNYKQWNKQCRQLIGKGFKCFDVASIIAAASASSANVDLPRTLQWPEATSAEAAANGSSHHLWIPPSRVAADGTETGASPPPATASSVLPSATPTKIPFFIKLHKVGGTTLGDVLHDAASSASRVVATLDSSSSSSSSGGGGGEADDAILQQQQQIISGEDTHLQSCAPLIGNAKDISRGHTMSCDWCCGGHQGKNIYEVCGPLPFNSLCTPPQDQVSVTLLRNPLDRFFSMYFFQLEEQGTLRERKQMARTAARVGYFQGFHDWIMSKLDEGNNGHLFFEPTFAGAYSSTCSAFPGCCDLDANFSSLDRALAMLGEVSVVGLTESFDDAVVLLALELGWDPALLAYADAEKKRVSSKKSRIDMDKMPLKIRRNITTHRLFQRELAIYNHGEQMFLRQKARWPLDVFDTAKARFLNAKLEKQKALAGKHGNSYNNAEAAAGKKRPVKHFFNQASLNSSEFSGSARRHHSQSARTIRNHQSIGT